MALKRQNSIVTERWERQQRETASLKTVKSWHKGVVFLPRQQAVSLNTPFLSFLFFFFWLRLQRRKWRRHKHSKMSGNSRCGSAASTRTNLNPRPATCVLHDVVHLQAEIYKEDFMKEQQEKERLWTKIQMLEEKLRQMSNMPQVNISLDFLPQAKQKLQLKSINISAPSPF